MGRSDDVRRHADGDGVGFLYKHKSASRSTIRAVSLHVLINRLFFKDWFQWHRKATEKRAVTVWLAGMSLMPSWQLSWTRLSRPFSLRTLHLIELSSLGRSNTTPNGRTLTKITSDSNYKPIQIHIGSMADVSCIRLIVSYQSNCPAARKMRDVNMMNGPIVK